LNPISNFDAAARTFDQHRALPGGVPEAIRAAVWECARKSRPERVLEVGAGSGRVGRTFVDAGDWYLGVDSSIGMLGEFVSRQKSAGKREARLIQADGVHLPFGKHLFDVVLLAQVLSGARSWRGLVDEAVRVLRPEGAIVVGQTVAPDGGVDMRMKRRLAEILAGEGVDGHVSQKNRNNALRWLESAAARAERRVAASWASSRSPRSFIERHHTANRFSTLPPPVQERALQQLSEWAESAFGSLDTVFAEFYFFELWVFQF
jgi:ubiquinone/menaquinone biosynthesis C-methylase UbiE